jgi:hypothetical protein
VRHLHPGGLENDAAVEDQVEIQRPGRPDARPSSTSLAFDRHEFLEQRSRVERRTPGGRAVEEPCLRLDADRIRFAKA